MIRGPDPRALRVPNAISEVTRRAIIDELLMRDEPYYGCRMTQVDFINRFLPLTTLGSTDSRYGNLYNDLVQHTIRNSDYTDVDVLCRHVKIYSCPDAMFGQFLAETLHPIVRDSAGERAKLLELYNRHLNIDGFEIAPAGQVSGRPTFGLRRLATPAGTRAAGNTPTMHGAVLSRPDHANINTSLDELAGSFYANVPDVVKPVGAPVSASGPNADRAVTPTRTSAPSAPVSPRKYDVVLSFASEQRSYAKRVAEALQSRGIKYFYDEDHAVHLWGKDMVETLGKIYSGESRFCVMFISEAYAKKDWTILERRNALVRALRERSEYILPVRFDDTVLDGLPETVGYVSGNLTPEVLADLVVEKIRQADHT